jgi:nitrite reductase/ring-hydroxylating ferredoxin subunit
MSEIFVSSMSDMADGDRRIVRSGEHEVGVFRKGDQFYAYNNYCLHAGGPVCEGLIINRVVDLIAPDRTYIGQDFSAETHFVCPWHGYEYDLTTGECIGDRRLKLKRFPVVERDGAVYVVI